ncbi:hypothetical protein CHU92_01670 [Flavobacterium cyanobacteriorum]|uniref:Lipocalin-like domain-containing protein n=1 Tax=Flavobacterium cyanobacteriorum TaxID=2022802 RepID=A0A255ZX44_9FLAO|nr:hypothetical protein [Flavobacterium cyanobacteriorum]OYQ46078.1 hypothetical protein CHU92_01670 [Flavobacterium cyanobacteriorum]
MKKKLLGSVLLAVTFLLTACSNGDDAPAPVDNVDTSQVLGKWIIYKAIYGDAEPELYDSNGTCGREVLEFQSDGEVVDTHYVDEDCMFGGAGTYSWWVLNDGRIAFGAHNSYHHIVTVTGNELVLDASEEADYVKYYIRAN